MEKEKAKFKKICAMVKESFYVEIKFRVDSIGLNVSRYIQDLIREDLKSVKNKEPVGRENKVLYLQNQLDIKKSEIKILEGRIKRFNRLSWWQKMFHEI